jgi:rhodanese-related sulfurtransferase
VQATDQYAGTLHARIVCVDDKEVRAAMTASWLAQMGWQVYVLVAAGEEKGFPENPVLGEAPRDAAIDAAALSELLARNEATVIDLSLSREYLSAHIPGAWFAIRARLEQYIQREPLRRNVVLTSEDGVLASLAVNEARAWTPLAVRYLDGGNAAWRAAGCRLPPIRAWPMKPSTCGSSPMSVPTASNRRWRNISRGRRTCCRESRGMGRRGSLPSPRVSGERVAKCEALSRVRGYLFFFRNRTPGASPFKNSTPATSSARNTAAIVGSCFAWSASILVMVLR